MRKKGKKRGWGEGNAPASIMGGETMETRHAREIPALYAPDPRCPQRPSTELLELA
jgi:hypothetical protein